MSTTAAEEGAEILIFWGYGPKPTEIVSVALHQVKNLVESVSVFRRQEQTKRNAHSLACAPLSLSNISWNEDKYTLQPEAFMLIAKKKANDIIIFRRRGAQNVSTRVDATVRSSRRCKDAEARCATALLCAKVEPFT